MSNNKDKKYITLEEIESTLDTMYFLEKQQLTAIILKTKASQGIKQELGSELCCQEDVGGLFDLASHIVKLNKLRDHLIAKNKGKKQ
jgi:hypothetical protein